MSGSNTAGSTVSGIGSALGSFGSAASSLFGAVGSEDAAKSFDQAAQIATENQGLEEQFTKLTTLQEQRQVQTSMGSTVAETGAAGLETAGSSLSLLASSAANGALTEGLTGVQGQILANGYAAQAAAYTAEGQAATASAEGGVLGGLLSGAGGIASLGKAFGFFGGS